MTTYLDLLPVEITELIYEKKHQAEMKELSKDIHQQGDVAKLLARAKASHFLSRFEEEDLDLETLMLANYHEFNELIAKTLGMSVVEKIRIWKQIENEKK